MSPTTTEAPDVTAVALNGAIVQVLKPGSAKTFSEYSHSVLSRTSWLRTEEMCLEWT